MALGKCFNPFAFTSITVTLITTIVYLGIAIPLIIVHESVPRAPSNLVVYNGLNITEAWLDLTTLSNSYHPYNSRRNDEVRDWLLRRIEYILEENGVPWSTSLTPTEIALLNTNDLFRTGEGNPNAHQENDNKPRRVVDSPTVTVFNDLVSNITFSLGSIGAAGQGRHPGQSVYFEGTNIMVYIRGTEDEEGDWWDDESLDFMKIHGKGGVLVNAHYDSVSTGFGATDDGVGVVSVLQLIRYFTTAGNRPKKGLLALLNNGEEDYLNGARAYTRHPISQFPHTFLNLEGAGAGGRATLFRSTDTEVTRAYATAPNPFGSVVAADGFKMGLVRSQTDYVVFEGALGLRGLDVAFWYPRSRYHTDQDDARHTSIDSLWHMLSASVSSTRALTSDTSSTFLGPRGDGTKGKVKNGSGTDAVWFDIFGKCFVLFGLRGLFAWSLTLLVASPLILILAAFLLVRKDKFYLFAAEAVPNDLDEAERVSLYGWRGLTRFPVALVASSGLVIGSAFLVTKVNPLIVYSSHYAVWSMMLSLYFIAFWWVMRGADFIRPSALHRGYAFLWTFIIGWGILVAATVFEDRFKIASGYIFVFLESSIFFATLISFCELFALPTKSEYARFVRSERDTRESVTALPDSSILLASELEETNEEEATETTPLFGGGNGDLHTTTFANYARRSISGEGAKDDYDDQHKPYSKEQEWSGKLPSWTWLLQFMLVAPFMLIVIGEVALFVVEAIQQTGPDGSSLLLPYILMATFTILLLLPIGPFVHRFSFHIPLFLFLIFVGTLIYSLVAFPFSANNRYKAYFVQTVDLETGKNQVYLSGLEDFIRPIISSLPSSSSQSITCIANQNLRSGFKYCSWEGLAPKVVQNVSASALPEKGYDDWLSFNTSRTPGQNMARFVLSGVNTRACVLRFDRPIKYFNVLGSATDERFDPVPETGSKEIRLWHREWDQPWTVDIEWAIGVGKRPGDEGMNGKVVCLWSDDNVEGVIPALDEIRRFAPVWSAVQKASDGLVEGIKRFVI